MSGDQGADRALVKSQQNMLADPPLGVGFPASDPSLLPEVLLVGLDAGP